MTVARGNTLPTIASIQSAVAAEFKVPVAWMREPFGTSGTHKRIVARPRQAAMALAFLLTEQSGPRIGHFFGGRDHTTVWFARHAIARRRLTDTKLDQALKRVTLQLVMGS